jgi:hypothetical protein
VRSTPFKHILKSTYSQCHRHYNPIQNNALVCSKKRSIFTTQIEQAVYLAIMMEHRESGDSAIRAHCTCKEHLLYITTKKSALGARGCVYQFLYTPCSYMHYAAAAAIAKPAIWRPFQEVGHKFILKSISNRIHIRAMYMGANSRNGIAVWPGCELCKFRFQLREWRTAAGDDFWEILLGAWCGWHTEQHVHEAPRFELCAQVLFWECTRHHFVDQNTFIVNFQI